MLLRSTALVLCLASWAEAETRDLIIVAGQSNAVGFDAIASALPPDERDKDVMFWWRVGDPPPDAHDTTSGNAWTHLQPQPKGSPLLTATPEAKKEMPRQYGNFADAAGGFGPEMGLARTLLAKEAKPLAIIKAAFSGTSVAGDWNADDPGPGGACFRALVETVKQASAAAKAKGVHLRPRALVWVQGESDATKAYAGVYADNLAYLLSRLRLELGMPGLRALIGVNTRFGGGENPHMPTVIAAQRRVAEIDTLTQYVDTEGAETLQPRHTHFTSKGTLEIGQRYANELLATKDQAQPLFNGSDLRGWDGDPKLWSVKDGVVVGENPAPDAMAHNSFLIWRGSKVKDFEIRATVRVIGDNNSGIQYRSTELKEVAPWVITGYQCDIHPAPEHTGMTYEERGRGIFGLNGKDVLLDPEGSLWQTAEHSLVKVDVSQWNEYRILAKGNHLQHFINGRPSSSLHDFHAEKRALEGLLAIQLHKGNVNRVEIRDLRLAELPVTAPTEFSKAMLTASAKKLTKPKTSRPQGMGPIQQVTGK
jgi:hypothetical protein